MKFDPLVKVQNNKIYKIADNSELSTENLNIVKVDSDNVKNAKIPEKNILTAVVCPWSKIELGKIGEENYNEELLAALREYLKSLENAGCFAFIVPQAEKSFNGENAADEADNFIKAFVHTARRIKDCTSVLGFAIATELMEKDSGKKLDENSWSQWFINEMNVKHAHYVYFAGKSNIKKFGLTTKTCTNELALY